MGRSAWGGVGPEPKGRWLEEEGTTARPSVIRVLIVDDHRAFADALGIAIDLQPDLALAGVTSTVEEALDTVRGSPPDVVLMDVRLPGVDGIEGVRLVKELDPRVRVVVLTGFADADAMARAALAGASGFFPKERPVTEVLQVIRRASEGGMVVEPATLAAVLARVNEPGRTQAAPPGLRLTERQRDVLALLAEGMDPRAIARTLGISVNTSRGHVKSVMAKLGAHSQLEAVVEAMRIGLLDVETPVKSDDPTGGDDRFSGRSDR